MMEEHHPDDEEDSGGHFQDVPMADVTFVKAENQPLSYNEEMDLNQPLQLSIEGLMRLGPLLNDVDLVGRACRHLFLSHVQNQPVVHDLFFPDNSDEAFEDRIDPDWFDFSEFATYFVCNTISRIRDPYNIHNMLDRSKIQDWLADCYNGPHWKKVGFALYTLLFPDLVYDRKVQVPFRAYMEDDSVFWARQLYEKCRDPQWQYTLKEKNLKKEVNSLLVKLHLLDPTQVFPAFTQLKKVFPDLNMELVTTNYLGEPFDWKCIRPEVETVIRLPMLPSNSTRFSFSDLDLYYGVQITEFIMQNPKDFGIWTGQYPDNKRTSKFRDRCALM